MRNMNIHQKYNSQSREFNTAPDLAGFTFRFLTEQFADAEFTLLVHRVAESPLCILNSSHGQRDLASYQKQLKQHEHPGRVFMSHSDYFEPIYIFIYETTPSHSMRDVLNSWQAASLLLRHGYANGHENCRGQMGDLIAQLLHDIHSLIDNSSETANLKQGERLTYQKEVNKKLLFFIRDLDLFKTDFDLTQFFKDSLAMINIAPSSIEISVDPDIPLINADMELFSMTINEIVKNGLHATGNNTSKLSIKAQSAYLQSPFISDPWLQVTITDKGKGISDDFLPYVKKPFFTTEKYLGYSGFGLAIADKIINAHGGFMKIESKVRKQTQVTIYLHGLKHGQEK